VPGHDGNEVLSGEAKSAVTQVKKSPAKKKKPMEPNELDELD